MANAKFVEALKKFEQAARELEENFDNENCGDYPEELGSFDEFRFRVSDWLDSVHDKV